MNRHSQREPSGRYAPADAPETDNTTDVQPDTVHVVAGQEVARMRAPVTLTYSGPTRARGPVPTEAAYEPSPRPDPLAKYQRDGATNSRPNPYLGHLDRPTYGDDAGTEVHRPLQGRSSMFVSPAMNAKITRAQKDARIVDDSKTAGD